jgi:hypothetical protein
MNFNFRNYINEIAHFLNENTEDKLPPTPEEENQQNGGEGNPQDGIQSQQNGTTPSAPPPAPAENEAAPPAAGGESQSSGAAPGSEVPQGDGAQGEDDGMDPEPVNQEEIAGASEKSASFFKAFSDLQGMYNNLKEILKSTSFGEDLDKVREAALQQEKPGGGAKPPANPPQQ